MSRSTVRRVRPLAMLVLLLFGCSHAGQHPPAGGGWPYGGMVAVANPLAAEAAVAVLRNGGHAVDAAIAAHAVLGLVEPQSSGLGGGAFMLVYERATNELSAYDGRETAPAGATPDMFMDHGEEMNFLRAWQSGRSVGTPGMVALYALAHERHGRLPMADVMQRAIELAEEGFEVSPRLAGFLARVGAPTRLDDNPATAAYFFPGGKPLAAGDIRDNPEYAHTLRRFVAEGPSAFYAGELARQIVAAAQAEPDGGTLSMEDLAGYKVAVRKPICGQAGADRICGLPPPSSGLAEIMILGLYDRLADPARMQDGLDLAAFVDAQRLAYADRDHYVADADFVPVPVHELINHDYLDARATQRFAPAAEPVPGDPGEVLGGEPIIGRWGMDSTREVPGTSHLSIMDKEGNVVAMTATVEGVFGSSRWAGGFLLNNQMTDFARTPTLGGKAVANQVAPGKRPRSSMSPVIAFDAAGEVSLVAGSPGGNSIVAYVAKVLVGVLRAGWSAQVAVDAPNIIARGPVVRVETGVGDGAEWSGRLQSLGYPVDERDGENSGLHVIAVGENGLEGAADPRREGRAIAVP